MVLIDEITTLVRGALPNAVVQVDSEDQVHFQMVVTCESFRGLTLMQQHRLVLDPLREKLKDQIHALQVKTQVSEG